jgi:hypothetical protein
MADLFDKFWEVYPRKVGKKAATKAFEKLDEANAKAAIADVEKRTRMRAWSGNRKLIPHASTYLNGERWSDEWEAELKAERDPTPGLGAYVPPEPKEPEREYSLAEVRINRAWRDYVFCSIRYGGVPPEKINEALKEKQDLLTNYAPAYRDDIEAGVISKARASFELVDLFLTRLDLIFERTLKDVVWQTMKRHQA